MKQAALAIEKTPLKVPSAAVAVLALHYQNEVLHAEGRIRVGLAGDETQRTRVIAAASRMLAGARSRKWPIVHVRIAFRPDYADCPSNTPIFRQTMALGAVKDGTWGSDFFPALAPQASETEFVITHQRISGFAGTPLEQTLRLLGTEHLLIAGVATHSVVEGTVRDAADRGFQITVASDACAAAQQETHAASLASMALVAQVTDIETALVQLGERT